MLLTPSTINAPRQRQQGFTLIELLMVIAVILVLASITFGISRGVQNAQARARVKADLAVISTALERFKTVYGDYPTTDNPASSSSRINQSNQRLVHSLRGNMDWNRDGNGKATGLKARWDIENYTGPAQGENLLDEEAFDASVQVDGIEQFQDPWGNPYIYDYTRLNGSWDNFGYILCSAGPDGQYVSVATDGLLTDDIRNDPDNIDNIYVNE